MKSCAALVRVLLEGVRSAEPITSSGITGVMASRASSEALRVATVCGAAISARLGAYVYRHGNHFYNFEGLRAFKEKFDPEWRSVYVAMPSHANIVAVTADTVSLIGGGIRSAIARK